MAESPASADALCPDEPFKNQEYTDRLSPSEANKYKNFLLVASTWAETSYHPEDLSKGFCRNYVINIGDRPIGPNGPNANHAVIGGVQGKWRRTGEGHMNFARLFLLQVLQEMYPKRLRIQRISEREFVKFHNEPNSTWDGRMKMNERAKILLEEIRDYILNPANNVKLERKDRVWDIFERRPKKDYLPKQINEELDIDMKPFLLYGWDKYEGSSPHENFLKAAATWAASVRSADENEHDQPCENYALIIGKDNGESIETTEDPCVLGVSQNFAQTGKGQMNFARAYVIMIVQMIYSGLLSIRPLSQKEFEKIQGHDEWHSKANMHVSSIQRLEVFKMLVLGDGNIRKKLKGKMAIINQGGKAAAEKGADEELVIDMIPFLLDGWDKVEESCTI
ncbi:hypothetical protein DM02DRAFT_653978 [Periconia macrospinosa]|uniref:Uncharacterized protein n=1 Tax=Periconia macrospinosa TaxID=97972 RepID=A0A2V1DUE5_9PLEO|nr:hypothetical protein DM02DRAFT_653978 [Periconia macrospinosa]